MLARPRAILTDIEGTTSSIRFVKDVLFPYARREIAAFVRAHRKDDDVAQALAEVAALEGRELDEAAAIAVIERYIDEDRKATPLKTLQGLIWRSAYESGEVRGHVYPDANAALRRWREAGIELFVFSSGSIAAQRLLFGHSDFGDMTPLFSAYFDTTSGAKNVASSYSVIATTIGCGVADVLFLSDTAAEIDAAQSAGMRVARLCRPEDRPSDHAPHQPCFEEFDAVERVQLSVYEGTSSR